MGIKYDIFISYRREGGLDYARPLKLELEKHGYNVFLDFDELKDGCFNEKIKTAIDEAPVFVIILSAHALDRCVNDDDWVRQEIEYAISKNRHIVPVNPDLSFEGFPGNTPKQIKEGLGLHQYSDILMGQLFEYSVKKMVSERIAPYVRKKTRSNRKSFLAILLAILVLLLVFHYAISAVKTTDVSNIRHFTVNGVEFEMVFVEGGNYCMGEDSIGFGIDADEHPVHNVVLSDYYIGKYEITQKQWKAVTGNEPPCGGTDANMPVGKINFYEAHEFIEKLNMLTGLNFGFPTEAQWEYAASGGKYCTDKLYSGSNNIEEVGWYKNNANGVVRPIGQKKPNELGIYDMSGNVWEWCGDYYDSTYYRTMKDSVNPQGAKLSPQRTLRGGSVQLDSPYLRNKNREGYDPSANESDYGLRIILNVK